MTQSDLWAIYVAKNPSMGANDSTSITLTSRGLKKLFDTTWEQAHDAGFDNGRAYAKLADEAAKKSAPASIFDEIFGGKK